jgi:hypothetical protein
MIKYVDTLLNQIKIGFFIKKLFFSKINICAGNFAIVPLTHSFEKRLAYQFRFSLVKI